MSDAYYHVPHNAWLFWFGLPVQMTTAATASGRKTR